MSRALKLEGLIFGNLTAIKRVENSNRGEAQWYCECSCGGTKIATSSHLSKGNVKSCGCLQKMIGANNPAWTGYKELTGKYFSNIRQGAKQRKLDFLITKKELWDLYIEQDKKCALTNVELTLPNGNTKNLEYDGSIDRLDSNKGYIIENLQWVWHKINRLKNNYDQDDFIYVCISSYTHEIY